MNILLRKSTFVQQKNSYLITSIKIMTWHFNRFFKTEVSKIVSIFFLIYFSNRFVFNDFLQVEHNKQYHLNHIAVFTLQFLFKIPRATLKMILIKRVCTKKNRYLPSLFILSPVPAWVETKKQKRTEKSASDMKNDFNFSLWLWLKNRRN